MRQFVPGLIVLFLVAIMFRVDLFFTAIYFLVAIALLSRVWMQGTDRRMVIHRHFEGRAFTGDTVSVELVVENTGLLPIPWVELDESVPLELTAELVRREVFSLGPHERRSIRYELLCRRRGYYRLGPLRGETGGLLDLERREVRWEGREALLVYPRVVSMLRPALPTRSALVELSASAGLFTDPSRLMGVRNYRRGDSQRSIHWRATARTGALVVKQYQPAIARDTMICLDLDVASYDVSKRFEQSELAIVVAASLASHIVTAEGLAVGLITEALDPASESTRRIVLPPRDEREGLVALLEVLAGVQLTAVSGFAQVVRQRCAGLTYGTTVVVITPQLSGDLAEAGLLLRRRGLAVLFVIVHTEARRPTREDSLAGTGVRHIWSEEDIRLWA